MEKLIYCDSERERLELLKETPPFLFLTYSEKKYLAENMTFKTYKEDEVILAANKVDNNEVYLVCCGSVKTFRNKSVISVIKKRNYFGEQKIILDENYDYDFIAMKDTCCYVISSEVFLNLLKKSRVFAEAIGSILRDDQGVFSAFEEFFVEIMRNAGGGEFTIEKILSSFRKLRPALHYGANSDEIDFGALYYAVKRLPENVTRTFTYLLTDDLPTEFPEPDATFNTIKSIARRRNIWEMLPGKNMALIRSGLSDFLDIVTCLCVYAVEAGKVRFRLHNPKLIRLINEKIKSEKDIDQMTVINRLPFSANEKNGLLNIWGNDSLMKINELVRHRERIGITVRRRVHNYNIRRMQIWTKQIGEAANELLGYVPNNFPDDYEVHIISSNSHSVTNCLDPLLIEKKDKIFNWAKSKKDPLMEENWFNEYDLLYALARSFFKGNPDEKPDRAKKKKMGMTRLTETASTGIEVQIFDLSRLKKLPSDPGIGKNDKSNKVVVINIDYAFGEQAEDIIRNLIFLFGRNLKSVNIMGKAGSLVGKRGDILLPTGFIEQSSDTFHPVNNTALENYEDLMRRIPRRDVYSGQLLTVAGTLLQNTMMLNFYHNLWNCIGLEMEGFYYYRQILKSIQLGVLPENLNLRFLYYVSDLPLEKDGKLSAPMPASEGIPPLYAVTRHILSLINAQGN